MPLQCGRPGFHPWVGNIPWSRERLPTPVFWPGEFLELYSPRGLRESDRTEWTFTYINHSFKVYNLGRFGNFIWVKPLPQSDREYLHCHWVIHCDCLQISSSFVPAPQNHWCAFCYCKVDAFYINGATVCVFIFCTVISLWIFSCILMCWKCHIYY